jgi:hypothetical protein
MIGFFKVFLNSEKFRAFKFEILKAPECYKSEKFNGLFADKVEIYSQMSGTIFLIRFNVIKF